MPNPISQAERSKYEKIWGFEGYHDSPGFEAIDLFWKIANPQPNETVMDAGAGGGEASNELTKRGLKVHAYDITDVGWRGNDHIPLTLGPLWKIPQYYRFDFVYCCDVMEHIPPEYTALVVDRLLNICHRAFFVISFLPDNFGAVIGQPLHLTVQPFTFWRDMFRELGEVYDARDQLGRGAFYVGR